MKPLWTFIALCFGFSWVVAAWLWSLRGLSHPFASLIMLLFMAGPAFAAIICAAIYNKGRMIDALGLKPKFNRWLILAWFAALVFVGGALGISLMAPGIDFQNPASGLVATLKAQDAPASATAILEAPFAIWLLVLQAAVIGALINSILLLSEELGWRGWLWDHLKDIPFWQRNFWIGLLWGVWHVPVILMGHNYPGMPIAGAFLFILFCVLASPVIGYFRERNGSVWAASVFHGTLNAAAGLALLSQSSIDMPWRGSVGIGGFVMLTLMCGLVWVSRRGEVR